MARQSPTFISTAAIERLDLWCRSSHFFLCPIILEHSLCLHSRHLNVLGGLTRPTRVQVVHAFVMTIARRRRLAASASAGRLEQLEGETDTALERTQDASTPPGASAFAVPGISTIWRPDTGHHWGGFFPITVCVTTLSFGFAAQPTEDWVDTLEGFGRFFSCFAVGFGKEDIDEDKAKDACGTIHEERDRRTKVGVNFL